MTIYLIKQYNTTNYKIGCTARTIEDRITELQLGSGIILEYVDHYNLKYGIKLEKTLHRVYSQYALNREWFNLPDDIVDTFKVRCKLIENNFDLLNEKSSWIHENNKRKI